MILSIFSNGVFCARHVFEHIRSICEAFIGKHCGSSSSIMDGISFGASVVVVVNAYVDMIFIDDKEKNIINQ